MGVLDKCCGSCKHFKDEDIEGWGWCTFNKTKTHCAQSWDCYNSTFNGWTEITPDNVDEIKNIEKRVVVASIHHNATFYRCLHDVNGLNSMAKNGGYYYYVLPKLMKEE